MFVCEKLQYCLEASISLCQFLKTVKSTFNYVELGFVFCCWWWCFFVFFCGDGVVLACFLGCSFLGGERGLKVCLL